jgi:chaperonin GroES
MRIIPLQDRVVLKRVAEQERTKGGLVIPDTAKEKPVEGVVVAVGRGKVLDNGCLQPPDVKAGDRVLFAKYGGSDVTLDGEEHLVLRADDLLGVIEEGTVNV